MEVAGRRSTHQSNKPPDVIVAFGYEMEMLSGVMILGDNIIHTKQDCNCKVPVENNLISLELQPIDVLMYSF